MADYLAYGFSAYEIEVKNHIIVRVFFAISVSNAPAWLSWYFYSQGAGFWATDFAAASAADSTRKIGSMINGLAGQFFTFPKQINVNDFANLNPQYGKIRSSPATCTVKHNPYVGAGAKGTYLDCTIVLKNKSGDANINFPLSDEGGGRSFLIPNMQGHVDYVGTVDLKKQNILSSLVNGPVVSSNWLQDPLRPDY
jgi:hypothetical protein